MGSAIPGQVGLVCIRKVAEQARESEPASSTQLDLNRRRESLVPVKRALAEEWGEH